jgi:hypothetical protein
MKKGIKRYKVTTLYRESGTGIGQNKISFLKFRDTFCYLANN